MEWSYSEVKLTYPVTEAMGSIVATTNQSIWSINEPMYFDLMKYQRKFC